MIFDRNPDNRQIPFWLYRPLLNWKDIYRWAIESGIEEMVSPNQLHTTLATVRSNIDWSVVGDLDTEEIKIEPGDKPLLELGLKNDVVCLSFDSAILTARNRAIAAVAPIDYPDAFHPHVTLKREHPVLPRAVYTGPLVFGPEDIHPFISGLKIPQQPVNRNQYRVPLGLPEHNDKEAKALEWRTLEKQRRCNAQKRRLSRIPSIDDYED